MWRICVCVCVCVWGGVVVECSVVENLGFRACLF